MIENMKRNLNIQPKKIFKFIISNIFIYIYNEKNRFKWRVIKTTLGKTLVIVK